MTVAAEPAKKKKRKREANMLVRFLGMGIAAVLALACVLGFASWRGMKLDFLPTWMQFNFNKPSVRADAKPNGQSPAPTNGQTPAANVNPAASNSAPVPDAGKTAPQTAGADQSQSGTGSASDKSNAGKGPVPNPAATNPSGKPPAPSNPAAGKRPNDDSSENAFSEPTPTPTPGKAATPNAGKAGPLAMNVPPKEGAKPDAKPAPTPGKVEAPAIPLTTRSATIRRSLLP